MPSADTPSAHSCPHFQEQPYQTVQLPPAKPLSSPPCPGARVCVCMCVSGHEGEGVQRGHW